MTAPIYPKPTKYLMPRDVNAVGPQNESEQRLYDLIKEAMDSGPSEKITVEELVAEIRQRINLKR
jgi:hypothetical protein